LFDRVCRSFFQLVSVPHTWPIHWLAETVLAAVVEGELLELEPPPHATPVIPRLSTTAVIAVARATDRRRARVPTRNGPPMCFPHSADLSR
jgi:hypothetical protein